MALFRRTTPPLGSSSRSDAGSSADSMHHDGLSADPMPSRASFDKQHDIPSRPGGMGGGPGGPGSASGGFKTDAARRPLELPGTTPARRSISSEAVAANPDLRRLIVGRDISLSGEIAACDVLVVEGTVEAKLPDGRAIEIAESGLFKGSVEIDDADIAGRFEGDILVRGRLRVRSSGRIRGIIRYGELEVEAGGQIVGDVQVVQTPVKSAATTTPTPSPASINPAPHSAFTPPPRPLGEG